jgi:phage-related protein
LEPIREIEAFEDHFEKFLKKQTQKVQDKIYKIFEIIQLIDRVPEQYLKHLKNTDGLYEIRIQLGNNIWRIFCFFDGNKLIILLNAFQKKTQKTPKREIQKAEKLKAKYFEQKKERK